MNSLPGEMDVLRDVSEKLAGWGIPFMVTGSVAMNFYAQPRMTRDIDMVIAVQYNQIDGLVAGFTPEYYVAREAVTEAFHNGSMFNVIHQASVIKVDLIMKKTSPFHQAAFERRRPIALEGFSTCIISKEDLVLSKLLWAKGSHSERQMGDVANLLQTECDAIYLDRWARVLGVDALLAEARHA